MQISSLKILIVLISLPIFYEIGLTQDLAFSQYYHTPFLNNPAQIGSFSNIRAFLNYRNQPLESGDRFTTPMASFTYPFFRRDTNLVKAGFGLSFIHDNQTDFLTTDGALLAFAYNFHWTRHTISFGLQGGFFQKRIDLSNAITSSQIINGIDDPTAQENLDLPNINYPVFGGGINWTIRNQWNAPRAYLGLSVQNINEPNISFTDALNNPLPSSLIANGGFHVYSGNGRLSFTPNMRWIRRLGVNYVLAGSWINFGLGADQGFFQDKKIQFGAWYHSNQALVMAFNYEQPKFFLSASYDLPTATQASNWLGNGAIEVTIGIKIYKKRKPKKDQLLPIQDTIPEFPSVVEDTSTTTTILEPPVVINNLPDTVVLEDEYEQIEFSPTIVRFTLSMDEPPPGSKQVLDYIARLLRTYPGTVIEVTGYTCNLGSEENNQVLSERRAQAVKDYLINQGVTPGNIITIGRGENNPIAPNTTEFGRQRNRRVVVRPIPQEKQ